jgi:copper chaperone
METTMKSFTVSGMTCQHCVAAVTRAIHDIDPTAIVSVSLNAGVVTVDSTADPAKLVEAIEEQGYEVG